MRADVKRVYRCFLEWNGSIAYLNDNKAYITYSNSWWGDRGYLQFDYINVTRRKLNGIDTICIPYSLPYKRN